MSEKSVGQCLKSGIAAVGFALICSVSGCGDTPREEIYVEEAATETSVTQDNTTEKEEKLVKICQDLYEKADQENEMADLETIRGIVARFGENGYPAVDSRNQVDMVRAEQLMQFCETVNAKGTAGITVIQADDLGGFVTYDLHTSDGTVDVVRSYYKYQEKQIRRVVTGTYQAEYWNTTDDGYLMFSGVWFSEEAYVLTLSGAEEHTALRMQPLDETCRELNRKYLLPIGYSRNNMFLTDWSEDDFGELDFYDLFDIFYPVINGRQVSYAADADLRVGAVYRIPKEVFENVIMTHLDIDSETLQSKTVYHPEDSTYEYKPRGFYETEYPEHPYPEVVGYTENDDGTITLTVHVVFPYEDDSCVFAHEVVVRLLENSGVQYVSNRILPSEDNREETWYTPRLTEEEWEEIYVSSEKSTETNAFPDEETIRSIQKKAAQKGASVTASIPYSNMENPEQFEAFLENCEKGESGSDIIYRVRRDGSIDQMKFVFDGTEMYVVGGRNVWGNDGALDSGDECVAGISEWKYTQKGWFCYEVCVPEPPAVSEVINGYCRIRVKPMAEEYRELSRKCLWIPGYQGNNLLCSNWDTEHMEALDYNGLYEYLYEMKCGKKFRLENDMCGIPAEEFESLIMEYFPVTAEQLRQYAVYDEEDQVYAWEPLGCLNCSPTAFGTSEPEVTDIRKNADGTVTLTVDALCDMVACEDAVITHELTMRFAEDGSFQYLGNQILDNGIMRIPDYQYRIISF